jgi:heme/copper-type cytochrome/quinol oxidase subunit 2
LRVTPTAAGDFRIICNEFCGIGHHTMVGRVIVVDSLGRSVSDNGQARIGHGGAQ